MLRNDRSPSLLRCDSVAHGHCHAVHVTEEPHRRLSCVGPAQSNGKASLPRSAFEGAARAFAEGEARKAGLIN